MATEDSITTASSPSPYDEAVSIACAKHLHQSLWLPETPSHGRLRVTFSTTSNFADSSLPLIFNCPPMFGGRWSCLSSGRRAESHGLRMISVDR